jgi:hypothetical protein
MTLPDKSAADSARELYAHRNDPGEWEDEPEHLAVRPAESAILCVRLPREELESVEVAAAAAHETLSDFVRKALAGRLGAT